jgi:hypothetical protein
MRSKKPPLIKVALDHMLQILMDGKQSKQNLIIYLRFKIYRNFEINSNFVY